ncbi:MAG: hypothetical protein WCW54_00075 [Candidatus Paceibacterota bacterium]
MKKILIIVLVYIILSFFFPVFPHFTIITIDGCDMVGKNCSSRNLTQIKFGTIFSASLITYEKSVLQS